MICNSDTSKAGGQTVTTVTGHIEYDLHYGSTEIMVAYEAVVVDGKIECIKGDYLNGNHDHSELWHGMVESEVAEYLNGGQQ